MADPTSEVLNGVLRLAGIDPSQLEVVSCEEETGPCTVRTAEEEETKVTTVEDLFTLVDDQWLQKHPGAAQGRGSNVARLFRPLNAKWVLVDSDSEEGADRILYHADDGWKLMEGRISEADPEMIRRLMEIGKVVLDKEEIEHASYLLPAEGKPLLWLLERLSSKDWEDVGLKAPRRFSEGLYPFSVGNESAGLSFLFLSPFNDPQQNPVTLRGNPDVVIPWSDPYLLMEWWIYLEELGVRVSADRGNMANATYSFKSLVVMDSMRTAEGIRFRLFSPLGRVEKEVTIPDPPKPDIQVEFPKNPGGHDYEITVYGYRVSVEAYFPEDLPEGNRKRILERVGGQLLKMPEAIIVPILEGKKGEKPLMIKISDRETALEKGWLDKNDFEITAGNYHSEDNLIWLNLKERDVGGEDLVLKKPVRESPPEIPVSPPEDASPQEGEGPEFPLPYLADFGTVAVEPPRGQLLFHEIGGHAFSDFSLPDDNAAFLEDSDRTALKGYYAWKLVQLFSKEELAAYRDLSRRYWDWRRKGSEDEKEVEQWAKKLSPFREKASERFVSDYAIEGPNGIEAHLQAPHEDFAEVMQGFLECLLGYYGGNDCRSRKEREPLMNLIGMKYLFDRYNVSKIGDIRREEVFSERAFQEVLGIRLEGAEETLEGAWHSNRSVTVFPVLFGIQNLAFRTADGMKTSWSPWLGLRWGRKKGDLSGGVSFDYSANFVDLDGDGKESSLLMYDGGAWFRKSFEFGALELFLEPSLGVRRASFGDEADHSFWLGNGLGLGFLGGTLAVQIQIKTNVSDFGGWSQLGGGIQFDIENFLRYLEGR